MSQPSIRVTLVIGSLGSGGAERNLMRLAQALLERGHSVSVMTLNPDIPDFYAVPTGAVRVEPEGLVTASLRWFDLPGQLRQKRALRRSLLATRPDLVVSFIDTCNVRVLSALPPAQVPVVVSERIDWRFNPLNWRWRLLRRLTYPRAKRVVSLARAPMEDALRYFPRWRCVHVPNPVPRIAPASAPRPDWFAEKNFVAMGRLVEQKGFDLLLRAFSRCAAQHPDWGLTILGDGPDRAALQAQAHSLGLSERVHFAGNVSPPFPLLGHADAFVFSSRFEAFGMALAEAMACGLPVVSFDCPSGPGDIIRNEVDGLLVPREDVSALTQAMQRLMDDPALRERLASRAPEVCERFEPQRVLELWHQVILDALAESRAQRGPV